MSLRRVEPINGQCPDGFEYVRGHSEKSGTRVREFCRKIQTLLISPLSQGSFCNIPFCYALARSYQSNQLQTPMCIPEDNSLQLIVFSEL